MNSRWSKCKIQPFIEKYSIDVFEFKDPISSYHSFNDFFIRKLKLESRPIHFNDAVIPADGRYYFYSDISKVDGFIVKGEKFDVDSLLQDTQLANRYKDASVVLARLCPVDYHRYHFPCDCTPSVAKIINGYLYSVNPIAIKQNIHIFAKNKRAVTEFETDKFGKVLFLEIGATNVGSINQTYVPGNTYSKGEEKGYFSFGGSALIILFEQGSIQFDQDLLDATKNGFEIRCLMGQSMGVSGAELPIAIPNRT
ncbi:MAG: archaetidylserine decarboxylase [Chlamydiota bacterium]|nr:archaetidylserine decarboxylase [Chlamydiota bacterium]